MYTEILVNLNKKRDFYNKFSNLKINDKLNDYIYNESLEGDYKNKVVININCKENISDLEKQDMIDIIRRNFGIQVKDLLYTYEKEQDKKAQFEYETNQRDNTSENPARPNGVKITRDCMVIEYQSYKTCTEYPVRMSIAKAKGYLTPPYIFGDSSYTELLCKEDCIFCHCPFYARNLFDELRHNHRTDYDEWVMEYFKDFK